MGRREVQKRAYETATQGKAIAIRSTDHPPTTPPPSHLHRRVLLSKACLLLLAPLECGPLSLHRLLLGCDVGLRLARTVLLILQLVAHLGYLKSGHAAQGSNQIGQFCAGGLDMRRQQQRQKQ